jgi:hypothetical protein
VDNKANRDSFFLHYTLGGNNEILKKRKKGGVLTEVISDIIFIPKPADTKAIIFPNE